MRLCMYEPVNIAGDKHKIIVLVGATMLFGHNMVTMDFA